MEIRKINEIDKESAASSLFTSDDVSRQPLAPSSDDFNCSIVNFGTGVKNKFHVHESDQILIVTEGKGIVATESLESELAVGEVVFAPAGEKHWHGAVAGNSMAHLSVTTVGGPNWMEPVSDEDGKL